MQRHPRHCSSTPLTTEAVPPDEARIMMQDSTTTTPLLPPSQPEVEVDSHDRARSTTRATRWMNLILAPLMDDRGDPVSVVTGLTALCIIGALLGVFVAPHDDELHPPAYRIASAAVGYIYFLAWSVSFYPQVLANCRRRATVGLSVDFCLLNVLGFACYTAYTVALYSSPSIRQAYRERQQPTNTTNTTDTGDTETVEIPVESNDVAFCIHALVLSCVTLAQIIWYNSNRDSLSARFLLHVRPMTARLLVVLMIWIVVVGPALVLVPNSIASWHWLDYLYSLSAIKVLISLVKYMPQVLLNMERQSTAGWSIWQILLDLTGGLLSDVQLVGDTLSKTPTGRGQGRSGSAALRAIWRGNPAKLALGTLSMAFDVIFMIQHYILYPSSSSSSSDNNSHTNDQLEEGEINNNDDGDANDAVLVNPAATITHNEDEREPLTTTTTTVVDGTE
mmetsp:Transcript_3988/g.7667  ORF Transcript_3988/g.7667 Transcript_3988/m.7667 type:complete len:449 (-) Transcript_3988:65-1411(-)